MCLCLVFRFEKIVYMIAHVCLIFYFICIIIFINVLVFLFTYVCVCLRVLNVRVCTVNIDILIQLFYHYK